MIHNITISTKICTYIEEHVRKQDNRLSACPIPLPRWLREDHGVGMRADDHVLREHCMCMPECQGDGIDWSMSRAGSAAAARPRSVSQPAGLTLLVPILPAASTPARRCLSHRTDSWLTCWLQAHRPSRDAPVPHGNGALPNFNEYPTR